MFFSQTTLLRHFVPFTHQLAVPWDKAGRQETCSKREEPRPSTWQGDSRTQQQAAADYLARGLGWAGGLFPTNFNPFTQPYATYDAALWKEKWDTQQQEQAPLAAHSLRFRHAHTLHQTHTHTHTHSLKDNWMLTHADAWNRPARHEKTLTLSHSGWFTGPRAYTVIRVHIFDKCIISQREITFLHSSH